MRSLRAVVLLASFLIFSCTAPTAGPGVGVHVTWSLEDPSATIPAGVEQLVVLVFVGDDPTPMDSISTVDNLEDMDGNGHPEVTRAGLPTGEPIRVVVRGEDAGGALLFVGHAGPFVLAAGERRYVDLQMMPIGAYAQPAMGALTGRFLHTSTSLPDGRVLIAGGFTRAMSMACPAGSPDSIDCFDLTASSEAFVYDPATARFFPIEGGMRQARGGHTATLLGDGRVLVAGGAARAMLVIASQSGGGFVPSFIATDEGGAAATSFELFRADDNPEEGDLGRDGDPGRGGFVGAANDPAMLGRLDRPRFLHSASPVPGSPNRVLLAGGLAGDAAQSWVIFDAARAGGYGVLDSAPNLLDASRAMPATVTVGAATSQRLWILGGGDAADGSQLAEQFMSTAASPNGTTMAAAAAFGGPGLNLWRPTALPLGDGTRALVVGWLGPACDPASPDPVPFSERLPGGTYVRCDYQAMRSYTLTAAGIATPTGMRNAHAFGAGARLSDGTVIVTGGFGTLALMANGTTDHFAANATQTAIQPALRAPRAFHTMSALEDRGVLAVGGITVSTTTDPPTVTLTAIPEVLYLP